MPRTPRSPTEAQKKTEPVENRIATGLHKLGLAMRQQTWLQANEQGLSPTQGQILAAISVEGPRTGTELSARLGLSLPTISDSVRVLVEKGLVVKKADPRHPRASLIELTSQGRIDAKQARSWPEFLASAVDTLSANEQETLLLALVKVIRALQESGQIPPHRMCITCTHFRANLHPGARPHHCMLLDFPLADRDLRLDCGEHQEADAQARSAAWQQFSPGR